MTPGGRLADIWRRVADEVRLNRRLDQQLWNSQVAMHIAGDAIAVTTV